MNEQKVNWHRLTGEEAVRQLHSNASCGLSRKEARSRFRKGGANTIFDPIGAPFSPLKRLLTDPILILTVAICLLAICFFEPALGIAALVPLLLWLLQAVRFASRMKKQKNGLLRIAIPRVRLIRQGKLVSLSAGSVVRGDVLLLQSGDVVPADCRLLFSDGLTVRFSYRKTGEDVPTVRETAKCAEAIYGIEEEIFAPDFENIVYAGSEVLSGSARAIAVEVGERSFLGATGTPNRIRGNVWKTGFLESIYPYLRLFGFAVLALSIPLSIIGLLISPAEFSAWRVFLPICVFALSTSAVLPYLFFEWLIHSGSEKCIKHPTCGSVPKTARTTDVLHRLDDLIVLGRSATSDGLLHFDRALCGETEIFPTSKEGVGVLTPLCEAFLLLANAEESLPVVENASWEGHQPYLLELSKICSFDLNALEVRLVHSSLSVEGTQRVLDVQTKETRFRLRFFRGAPEVAIRVCGELFSAGGRRLAEPASLQQIARRFAMDAAERSATVITVIREESGRSIFVGCLAMREAFLPNIPQFLDSFLQNGTNVRIFLERETAREVEYPLSCGCTDRAICTADGMPLSEAKPSDHFFAGYSRRTVLEYVRSLRQQGRCVAVLGGTSADRPILAAAALRLAYEAELPTGEISMGFEAGNPVEEAKGFQCVPSVCRDADLLIQTASENGGGLSSVLYAERVARESLWRVRLLLKHLASLQILRTLIFLSTLLSGLGTVAPCVLLCSSLLPDFVALFLTLKSNPTEAQIERREGLDSAAVARLLARREIWFAPTVSALLLFLSVSALRIAGLLSHETALPIIATASILMQTLLLLFGCGAKESRPSTLQAVITLCVLLLPMLVAILLSVWIAPVSQILGLGAWNAASLTVLGLSTLASLGCTFFFSRFS